MHNLRQRNTTRRTTPSQYVDFRLVSPAGKRDPGLPRQSAFVRSARRRRRWDSIGWFVFAALAATGAWTWVWWLVDWILPE